MVLGENTRSLKKEAAMANAHEKTASERVAVLEREIVGLIRSQILLSQAFSWKCMEHMTLQEAYSKLEKRDIEKQELINQLENHALEDVLTGLPNRRYILMRGRQLEQAGDRRTSDKCLCVIFLDLNLLKVINDLYGHDEGDRLLIRFSGKLRAAAGKKNIAGRFGGDEFIMLHISDTPDDAARFAKRIQKVFNYGFYFRLCNGKKFKVTTAVGYACSGLLSDQVGFAELLKEADSEMYKNKAKLRE